MPKYTRNDDGTLTQETDGGYKALVIDPDGSFEREMNPPAGAAEFVAAAPHVPAVDQSASYQSIDPATRAALAQPSVVGPTANPGAPAAYNPVRPQVAPLAPQEQVEGPKAVLIPGGTESKTESVRTSGGSTSGLDEPSKRKLEAAGAKTQASMLDASAKQTAAAEEVAGQREARAKQDYMSGFIEQVGAQEAEERYKRDYDEAMAGIKQARLTPPDPAKAWGSEKNEWAFIAGLGGALAMLDEGISRLQKRGGAKPDDMIEKMVNASLAQQEQEMQQKIAAGQETAETARDNMLNARIQVNDAAAKVLGARKLLATSAEEAAFLDAEEAKRRLAADTHAEELAKATATTKSSQWSNQTQTKTETTGDRTMLVVPGSERSAEDQKLIQDTLSQAYPNLKPNDAQGQWDDFQKQYIGTSAMRTAVKQAQDAISSAAESNDVAGFGPIAKFIPTDFASRDAVQKRQAVGQAVSLYIKSISGAAATDKESERLLTNISGSGDYATMKSGLDSLAGQSEAIDREMQKTKPQLYGLASYLGRRQGAARGADKAVEKF